MRSLAFFLVILAPIIALWPIESAYAQAENRSLRQQINKTNPLFGYLVGPGTEKMNKPILRPFATDGCSLSPNEILNYDFADCCVQHDVAYWLGGTLAQKVASDSELQSCISSKANATIADTYHRGVSFGGGARRPNTFRWGYGWDQMRPYGPLTAEEMGQAERLYGKDIHQLKEMVAQRKYTINLELLTLDFLNVNRFRADKLVYYYLQNNLKRNDIVTYSTKMTWEDLTWYYRIRLQSCGDKDIYINLNRTQAWIDAMFSNLDIDTAPWSDLQKYILSVQDPGNCLK